MGRRRAGDRHRGDSRCRAGSSAHRRGDLCHRPLPRPVSQRDALAGPGRRPGQHAGRTGQRHCRQQPAHRAGAAATRLARRRSLAGGAHADLLLRIRRLQHRPGRRHAGQRQLRRSRRRWPGPRRRRGKTGRAVPGPDAVRLRPGQPALGRESHGEPLRRAVARRAGRRAVALLQPLRHAHHRRSLPVPGRPGPGGAPSGWPVAGAVHQQPARRRQPAQRNRRGLSRPRPACPLLPPRLDQIDPGRRLQRRAGSAGHRQQPLGLAGHRAGDRAQRPVGRVQGRLRRRQARSGHQSMVRAAPPAGPGTADRAPAGSRAQGILGHRCPDSAATGAALAGPGRAA